MNSPIRPQIFTTNLSDAGFSLAFDFHIETIDAAHDGGPLNEGWTRALRQQNCDVYYELDFLRAAQAGENGQIHLALFENAQGVVVYPFVLHLVDHNSANGASKGTYYDIVNVFEYGGPLVVCEPSTSEAGYQELLGAFDQPFGEWCHEQGVITEFVRLHPMLGNHLACTATYEVNHVKNHVTIDLQRSEDEILASMSRSCRRNIRRAQSQDYVFRHGDASLADHFAELYNAEMDRLAADEAYRFRNEYFGRMADLPSHLGSMEFLQDQLGQTINTMIVLHGTDYAYYHLSAKNRAHPVEVSGSELLIFDVACRMKRSGRKFFHLGGAGISQTGLLEFKRRFSPNVAAAFHARKIRSPKIYEAWYRKATDSGDPRIDSGFFPFYRAPVPTKAALAG